MQKYCMNYLTNHLNNKKIIKKFIKIIDNKHKNKSINEALGLFCKHGRLYGLPYYLTGDKKYRQDYMDNLARNLLFINELAGFLDRFYTDILLLKGVPCSFNIYSDPGIRTNYDCDILVLEKNKYDDIKTFLLNDGWQESGNYNFKKEQFHLDFHFSLLNTERIPSRKNIAVYLSENITNYISTGQYQNIRFQILSPEPNIIFLLLHFLKHNFKHYVSLIDIYYLLKTSDKKKLIELTVKNRLITLLYYIFSIYFPGIKDTASICDNQLIRNNLNKTEWYIYRLIDNCGFPQYLYKLSFYKMMPLWKLKFQYIKDQL